MYIDNILQLQITFWIEEPSQAISFFSWIASRFWGPFPKLLAMSLWRKRGFQSPRVDPGAGWRHECSKYKSKFESSIEYNNSNKLGVPIRMNPGIMKQVSNFRCYKFSRFFCPQWTLLTAFSDGWPTVPIAEEIAAALGSYNLWRLWRWTPSLYEPMETLM